jgi:hypothetical protein
MDRFPYGSVSIWIGFHMDRFPLKETVLGPPPWGNGPEESCHTQSWPCAPKKIPWCCEPTGEAARLLRCEPTGETPPPAAAWRRNAQRTMFSRHGSRPRKSSCPPIRSRCAQDPVRYEQKSFRYEQKSVRCERMSARCEGMSARCEGRSARCVKAGQLTAYPKIFRFLKDALKDDRFHSLFHSRLACRSDFDLRVSKQHSTSLSQFNSRG